MSGLEEGALQGNMPRTAGSRGLGAGGSHPAWGTEGRPAHQATDPQSGDSQTILKHSQMNFA